MARRRRRALATALTVVAAAVVLIGGGLTAVALLAGRDGPVSPAITPRCVATTDAGTAELDPEQAANAALIAAVGQARGMSPRAVTIALATALQESKLRNLDYGDRDSLGLFQQRPSQDWGTPEEIMNPLYSAGEFYSELAKVPGFETMPITEAAQAVQRSAFPDAYAQHEPVARSFASSLTGHSPAALTCVLGPAGAGLGPEGLVAVVRAEWGEAAGDQATISPAQPAAEDRPAEPAAVKLRAGSSAEAWAYAQWAVAKADELAIESVTVAGQAWGRETGGWSPAPSDAGGGATGDDVIVRLH
jgi:hypothetical protein